MQAISVRVFGITLGVTVSCLFFVGKTIGFDWFSVWTAQEQMKIGNAVFVPSAAVQTPVVGLAIAHFTVGKGQYVSSSKIAKNGSVFGLLQEQRALLGVDILQLLRNKSPEEKKKALDTHLRHMNLIIQQSTTTADDYLSRAQRLHEESQVCLGKKRSGDKQFFDGAQSWKDAEIQAGLAQSLEYAPCYITKRIESNASRYLGTSLKQIIPWLVQRNGLLTKNHDVLLMYNELLEGSLLDELRVLKSQLNTLYVPTQNDIDSVLSFTRGGVDTLANTQLNSVFFPGGKIPTFNNPGISLNAP